MEIAVLDDYQNVARRMADWSRLEQQHRLTFFTERMPDQNTVADTLAGFDIICLMGERTPFPEALILRLPNLELIVTSGSRNAAVDMTAAALRNILVCGTDSPGARAPLTPDIDHVTDETHRAIYSGMIAAIEAWLAGKPINVLAE